MTETAFFQRGIYYRERLRAYVCYTGRFVVGRGRECSGRFFYIRPYFQFRGIGRTRF